MIKYKRCDCIMCKNIPFKGFGIYKRKGRLTELFEIIKEAQKYKNWSTK